MGTRSYLSAQYIDDRNPKPASSPSYQRSWKSQKRQDVERISSIGEIGKNYPDKSIFWHRFLVVEITKSLVTGKVRLGKITEKFRKRHSQAFMVFCQMLEPPIINVPKRRLNILYRICETLRLVEDEREGQGMTMSAVR